MPGKILIPYPPNPKIENSADYTWNGGRPFLFTVSEPSDPFSPLFDVALALHSNPDSVDEKMTKSKSLVQTYGGFVEFMWPDDLDSVSCSGSTGGFISPKLGYTAAASNSDNASGVVDGRRGTMAYERFQDFLDIFHMNGMVFDSTGKPAIRGRIVMMYDRGIFSGHFSSFDVEESADKPFTFNLSWEFKIEDSVYRFGPGASRSSPIRESF